MDRDSAEDNIHTQVDWLFVGIAAENPKDKIAIAAFQLAHYVREEKIANIETVQGWFKRDEGPALDKKTLPAKFGSMIFEGFRDLGIGISGGHIPDEENPLYEPGEDDPVYEEFSEEPVPLEAARERLDQARKHVASLYGLSPGQLKRPKDSRGD